MKPIGFWSEDWEVGPYTDFVVEIEADEGKILKANGYSSVSIWAAAEPIKSDGSQIDQEWADGLLKGESNLEHFITPIEGEIGSYAVQENVKLIFVDKGIKTWNGYPQAHLRGPAVLQELESDQDSPPH